MTARGNDLVEALQAIAALSGRMLLWDTAPPRDPFLAEFEQGSAAAFEQAAALAKNVLEAECATCGNPRFPHRYRHPFKRKDA